jgi:hypothetical protein
VSLKAVEARLLMKSSVSEYDQEQDPALPRQRVYLAVRVLGFELKGFT